MSTTTPGRRLRGQELPHTKLTEPQVREIRRISATTTRGWRSIAQEFGVSRMTVADILQGRSWTWVADEVQS